MIDKKCLKLFFILIAICNKSYTTIFEDIAQGVSSAQNTITQTYQAAQQGIEKGIHTVEQTAQQGVHAVQQTVQQGVESVTSATKEAEAAIQGAVQSAESTIAQGTQTILGTKESGTIQVSQQTPTPSPDLAGKISTSIDKIVGHVHNTQGHIIRFEQANKALSANTPLIFNSITKDFSGLTGSTQSAEQVIDTYTFPDNSQSDASFLKEYKVLIKWKDNNFYELARFFVGSSCKTMLFGKIGYQQYKDAHLVSLFDSISCKAIPQEQNVFAVDPKTGNHKYWTEWGSYWSVLENQSYTFSSGETIHYNLGIELRPKKPINTGFDQAGFYFYLLSSEGTACEDPGTGAPGIAAKDGTCKLTLGADCQKSPGKKVTKYGCIGLGQECNPINGKKGIVTEFTNDHDIICKETTSNPQTTPSEGTSCMMPDNKTKGIIKNGTCTITTQPSINRSTRTYSTHGARSYTRTSSGNSIRR